MTLSTRVDVETAVVSRLKRWMEAVGFSTTIVGINEDIDDPYNTALRYFDITDVSALGSSQDEALFLDIVELRVLQSIVRNYDDVTTRAGERQSNFSDFHKIVQAETARKLREMAEMYGYGEAEVSLGAIGIDYAEDGE